MKKKNKDKIKSKAWIGRFSDDSIGWCTPDHISGYGCGSASRPVKRTYVDDADQFYLCEVSIKVLKNKKGKYINRSAKALGINKT